LTVPYVRNDWIYPKVRIFENSNPPVLSTSAMAYLLVDPVRQTASPPPCVCTEVLE